MDFSIKTKSTLPNNEMREKARLIEDLLKDTAYEEAYSTLGYCLIALVSTRFDVEYYEAAKILAKSMQMTADIYDEQD